MARGPFRSRRPGKLAQVKELADKCLQLKVVVQHAPDGELDPALQSQIVQIDLIFATRDGKRSGVIMFMVAGVLLALALITYFNWALIGAGEWLSKDLFKYILMGVLGAVIFFFTEGAFASRTAAGPDPQTTARGSITRLALAVLLPIVVVVVLMTGEENKDSLWNPDWVAGICFGIGYSSRLASLLLEKIVEKGSKMIEAI